MDDLVLPPVAKNITYYCKKCDSERYHVVLAHKSTIAAQIQCEVCKSKKTYKITEPKKGKTMTRKKATRKSATSHKATYDEIHGRVGAGNAQPYSIRSNFEKDTAIDHPKFGLGFVTNSLADKIEVCFEDSARLLVHNRN